MSSQCPAVHAAAVSSEDILVPGYLVLGSLSSIHSHWPQLGVAAPGLFRVASEDGKRFDVSCNMRPIGTHSFPNPQLGAEDLLVTVEDSHSWTGCSFSAMKMARAWDLPTQQHGYQEVPSLGLLLQVPPISKAGSYWSVSPPTLYFTEPKVLFPHCC